MKLSGVFLACAVIFLVSTAGLAAAADEAKVVIKMASIAPKGSNIANVFDEIGKQIREKTNNEVAFKTYWGGVQGDEKDMLRKIKLGQLHGGGFMGPGLGLIVPEVRITELPYIFRNYEEVAYVRSKLQPTMDKLFEEKGFKVLGWMDLGFYYTFSKEPLLSLEIARRQKWWTMEGEPIGQAMFQALNISPISLSISDVATSLSTNMIDCAASTPFGAVAFQWYSRFKYMAGYPTGNLLGATIISKSVWDRISPASQKIMLDIARKEHDKLGRVAREEDAKSLVVLKKAGIVIVPHDPKNKDMQFVFEISKKVREGLVGKLYSRDLMERTLVYVDEYRRAHPKDTVVMQAE
ncbi:MAG TPA: TRAP transporter substrate-binding protein DctP [Desulfomonilia bacterium]|nr:TRAP transporter substrate-binding protein DctP [Desulfomonilia bacterium]